MRLLLASRFFATAAKGTTESQQNLSSDRTPHVLAPRILHCDGNWWCSYVNYNTSGSHRVTNGGGGGECHCSRSCARRERRGMRDTRRHPQTDWFLLIFACAVSQDAYLAISCVRFPYLPAATDERVGTYRNLQNLHDAVRFSLCVTCRILWVLG